MIQLTDEQANEIADAIDELKFQFNYNPDGCDYSCAFCHETARPRAGINHAKDCQAQKFLAWLGR